jgi:hypothetical protein
VTSSDVRAALRAWVAERNPGVAPEAIADDTPLIEARYLTSLQIGELLLFIEELRRSSIDPASLKPGVFRSLDTICATFFPAAG